MEFKS